MNVKNNLITISELIHYNAAHSAELLRYINLLTTVSRAELPPTY